MTWQDRPYADPHSSQPPLRMQLRRPSTAVGWLIVANVVVYFLDAISQNANPFLSHRLFGLSLDGIARLFLWQPFTYMFFHGGVMHLLLNMLGLYVFGAEFERAFGRQRFLQFYVTCGVVGGLAYLVLSLLWPHYAGVSLIGASGAIYGLLMAAVIFFPHIQVILIIFPMPIRVFALIVAGILLLQLVSRGGVENAGGEVCHIAGAVTALGLFKVWRMMPRVRIHDHDDEEDAVSAIRGHRRSRLQEGLWARKQKKLAQEQAEVDRILTKVHEQGIQSLSWSEKKILARATQRQKENDQQAGRIDQL